MKNPIPFLLLFSTGLCTIGQAAERPNILWLYAEDTSPWMDCYGYEANKGGTPNIDSIAEAGVRFARAYVPAPVCSACRSSMMVGANQIRVGSHEHRSSRAKDAQLQLPKGITLLPQLLKDKGYYTFNHGKTDYNFVWDQSAVFSDLQRSRKATNWEKLAKNQPFFGQIQLGGGKNGTSKFPASRRVDPATVPVPADYPQNDLYRGIVAQHCDAIRVDDDFIGDVLQSVEEAGMADNTIIVYFSDHGANNLVRHKQMPTEGGLHVPFVVQGPEKYVPQGGIVRKDLVSTLDLSATTLAWAGLEIPKWYEGRDLFAKGFKARSFVGGAKDRLDHTIDRVRTVRTETFRYTRNYKLDRIFLQPQYRDNRDYLKQLKQLYAEGKLSANLKRIYFGERPAEELYDVKKDPAQVHNLAGDPAFAKELRQHRQLLESWLADGGDKGAGEESEAALRYNGEAKKWGTGVNVEYESYREDSDGDGLSDTWENVNGRDPEDGRLVFKFDCGGWQTEGWESAGAGITDNLAGFLGFLDFHLGSSCNSISRKGLEAKATPGDKELQVRLQAGKGTGIQVLVNGQALGEKSIVNNGKKPTTVRIPLKGNDAWKGTIQSLRIDFDGKPGSLVEVDAVEVVR